MNAGEKTENIGNFLCGNDKMIALDYRVFSKGRNAVGPSKSLIFWTFSDILDIF